MLRPAELLLSYSTEEIDSALDPAKKGFIKRMRSASSPDLDTQLTETHTVSGFRTTRRRVASVGTGDSASRHVAAERPVVGLLLQGLEAAAMPVVAAMLAVAAFLGFLQSFLWIIGHYPSALGWAIAWGFLTTFALVVFIAAWALIAGVLAAHAALHWPIRRFGLLIAGTYVAGSGAPYWSGRQQTGEPDDGIIRLPIPAELKTMSFAIDPDLRAKVTEASYRAVHDRLQVILGAHATQP